MKMKSEIRFALPTALMCHDGEHPCYKRDYDIRFIEKWLRAVNRERQDSLGVEYSSKPGLIHFEKHN